MTLAPPRTRSFHRSRPIPRALALAAVLSVGIAPGLPAAHAGELAPTSGEAYRAAGERLTADPAVVGYGSDGSGGIAVLRLDGAPVAPETAAFVDGHRNVGFVDLGGRPDAYAADDVLGAHGIELAPPAGVSGDYAVCSLGFSAYTADFRPAGVTAAHCTKAEDEAGFFTAGAATEVRYTRPSRDPFLNGGEYWNWERLSGGARGDITGWQFGAPDDGEEVAEDAGESEPESGPPTPQPTGDPRSTDIAVIEFSAAGDVLPAVSSWDAAAAAEDDLHASVIPITGTGTVEVGDAISRTGRTTGLRSGEVTLADGWLDVDGVMVRGFGSNVVSDFGDSGGPVFNDAGEALGVVSAGVDLADGGRLMWSAAIDHGLDELGNPVRIAVDRAPRADAPFEQLAVGRPITGTGAEGFSGGTYVLDDGATVAVDVEGDAWSFTLPESAADPAGRLFFTSRYTVSRPLVGGAEGTAPEAPAPEEPSQPAPTDEAPAPTDEADPDSSEEPRPAESESEEDGAQGPSATRTRAASEPAADQGSGDDRLPLTGTAARTAAAAAGVLVAIGTAAILWSRRRLSARGDRR